MGWVINKIFRYKVAGGALQYTILFSLLIVICLSLFLMYVRLSSLEVISSQQQSQLIENIQSSVILLEEKTSMFEKQSHRLHLLDDTTYLNNIEITEWGLYDIVNITSKKNRHQLSKIFLFTDNIKKQNLLPSLYFSGSNQYLTIGGKTYLGDNTFLPAYGVRKSYVGGIGYNRDSLVQGHSFKAGKTLPLLNKRLEKRYTSVKNKVKEDSNTGVFEEIIKDSLNVSFNDESLVIKCPDRFYLKDKFLNGNIIISGKKIRISNSCQLNHCIIIADTILLDNQFSGEVQLFANNYIEVGDSSTLRMPSILYLDNKKSGDRMLIKSNSRVQADVIIPHAIREQNEILITEEGCNLIGQVYCKGYSSFEGVLFGSFFTNGFIKRSPNGLYENYLLDVCIDSKRLPEEYCGISLINESIEKRCAEEIH